MKIAIIGTGNVGRALGGSLARAGHEVTFAGRDTDKAQRLAVEIGGSAAATAADAAKAADVIVLAIPSGQVDAVVAGIGSWAAGKIVLDATNPLDFSKGMPPLLVGGLGDSGGERHQRLLPGAHVVKAFNTVGNALMFRPQLPGGPPDMFICGNDAAAKRTVGEICRDFGWGVVDVGGIDAAHYLEAMCLVWVLAAVHSKDWNRAFKFLRT